MRYAAALVLVVFAGGVTGADADPVAECADAISRSDWEAAVAACTKAAEQGDAMVQTALGVMYDEGQGVPENDAKAVEWYTKAAEQGYALAQSDLGRMYADGEGVPVDYAKAIEWYVKAAEQGDAYGQRLLSFMYVTGKGVPVNEAKGLEWLMKAAEQGDAHAQYELAKVYGNGRYGVPKDKVRAFMWLSLADSLGHEDAAEARNFLGNRMRRKQIVKAEQLAREWSERYNAKHGY